MSWGVVSDGASCAWAPMDPDPDRWPAAMIGASDRMTMNWLNNGVGFSGLLRLYAERDPLSVLTVDPDIGEVRFTPYRPDPR